MLKKYSENLGLATFPLMLSLPIPLKYSAIGLILFCVICLLNRNKPLNFSLIQNKSTKIILICFVCYFFIDSLVSLLFGREIHFFEVKLPFLILPIVFLFSSEFITLKRIVIVKAFVLGQLVYVIYAVCYMVYFYKNLTYEDFAFDGYLRYSLYHHLPGAIHHTYLGLNLFLAVVFLSEFNLIKNKVLKYFVLAVLLESSFFLSSKSMLIVLVIYLIIKYLAVNKKILIIGSVLVFASLCFYDFSWVIGKTRSSYDQRIEIWQCAIQLISNNFVSGIGSENVKQMIYTCNNLIGYNDAHNLWIQEWLSNGIFGIVLLIILFVSLIKVSFKNNLLGYFIIIILVASIIEHFLNLQRGVMFFTFFCLLLLMDSPKQTSNNKIYSS